MVLTFISYSIYHKLNLLSHLIYVENPCLFLKCDFSFFSRKYFSSYLFACSLFKLKHPKICQMKYLVIQWNKFIFQRTGCVGIKSLLTMVSQAHLMRQTQNVYPKVGMVMECYQQSLRVKSMKKRINYVEEIFAILVV